MPAYKEKFINEITSQDVKLAISGLIINKEDNLVFIDDNTGVIPVEIETNLPINTYVRVYGYLINNEQIKAELIQDLTQANKQLYNKIKKLLNQK